MLFRTTATLVLATIFVVSCCGCSTPAQSPPGASMKSTANLALTGVSAVVSHYERKRFKRELTDEVSKRVTAQLRKESKNDLRLSGRMTRRLSGSILKSSSGACQEPTSRNHPSRWTSFSTTRGYRGSMRGFVPTRRVSGSKTLARVTELSSTTRGSERS